MTSDHRSPRSPDDVFSTRIVRLWRVVGSVIVWIVTLSLFTMNVPGILGAVVTGLLAGGLVWLASLAIQVRNGRARIVR